MGFEEYGLEQGLERGLEKRSKKEQKKKYNENRNGALGMFIRSVYIQKPSSKLVRFLGLFNTSFYKEF